MGADCSNQETVTMGTTDSIRCKNLQKRVLLDLATDIVVQQGFLVRVGVSFLRQQQQRQTTTTAPDFHLCLSPTLTVTELKEKLAKHYRIEPAEIRLEWHRSGSSLLAPATKDDEGEAASGEDPEHHHHLLFGPLSQVGCNEFNVIVKREVPDPVVQSLLQHVGYEDWKELDEVMNKMLTKRKPNHCFCGNSRTEFTDSSPMTISPSIFSDISCSQCGHTFVNEQIFQHCPDTGHSPSSNDNPYAELEKYALKEAASIARMPCNSRGGAFVGIGPSRHAFSSNHWRRPLGGGFGVITIPNSASTTIVHRGAQVHILFRQTTLDLLEKEEDKKDLQWLEVTKETNVLFRPTTIGGIDFWTYSKVPQSKIFKTLEEAGSRSTPKLTELRLDLKSYGLKEVVYEAYMGEHSFWDDAE